MNIYKKYLLGLALSLFVFLALSSFASAQTSNVEFPYWPDKTTPLLSCSGDYTNPSSTQCRSLCDVISTFQRILYFIMTLILFVGAPIMFILGGGMIFFAGTNPSLLEQGKKVIWGAVIGVVLALSAYIIVGTFLWLIGNPEAGKKDAQGNSVQRVSWPDISCDPAAIFGGQLELWKGNATAGPVPNRSTDGGGGKGSPTWSGCKGFFTVGCHFGTTLCEGKTCECVTGATAAECKSKQ